MLLVGPSGSGKSTWAARWFDLADVLSSDAFRVLVGGDATDQEVTGDAFQLLHAAVRARLRRGRLTVVDATNLTSGARSGLLRLAGAADRPCVAVVFETPLDRCLARNARRPDRQVPEEVVRRQVSQLPAARSRLAAEGFAAIHVVRAPSSGDPLG